MSDRQIIPYTEIKISTMPSTFEFDFGDFTDYGMLSMHVNWSGLNAADAYVAMMVRQHTSATWTIIDGLRFDMTTPAGSCLLVNREMVCTYGGIYVYKGLCTSGTLKIWTIPQVSANGK
jgi:hypothetical protein